MRLIPELRVHTIEKGCSGMAGIYGLQKRNFEQSLQMGAELLNAIDNGDFVAATSECSSCRLQMAQRTIKRTVHPLKLLAHAYGLLPKLAEQLETEQTGLTIT